MTSVTAHCPLQCGCEGSPSVYEAQGLTIFVCSECLGVAFDGGVLFDDRKSFDLSRLLRPIIARVIRKISIDPLTQVKNQRFFFHRLATELNSASHRYFVSVAAFSFDLEELYWTAGARGGDTILQSIAAAFLSAIRTGDNFARVESNTFGLILPNADEIRAGEIAHRIIDNVAARKYHTHDGKPIAVKFHCAIITALVDEFPEAIWQRLIGNLSRDEQL